MNSPILVTGGTGRLGRLVVARLREAGADVRILSRRHGGEHYVGDLSTGSGVDAAVAGVTTIVHCATSSKGDADATRRLLAAAQSSRPHIVYVSIVGVDKVSWSYTRAKLDAERHVTGSGLLWTILRAAQFYDYLYKPIRSLARLPVMPVPSGFRVQPVDEHEVAHRLADLALSEPVGRVPDLVGPQATTWEELVRVYLDVSGRRRWVVPVRLPGMTAVRDGALLPASPYQCGQCTWREYIDLQRPHVANGSH